MGWPEAAVAIVLILTIGLSIMVWIMEKGKK